MPSEDSLKEEDNWVSRDLGTSRNGGRGFGSGARSKESGEGEGLLGGLTRHEIHGEPYYQEGMLQNLLRVESKALESPYLPSVQYWAAYANRPGIRQYLEEAGYDAHPTLEAGEYMSCLDAAKFTLGEKFQPSMLVRNRKVPEDFPGGAPLAAWRWDAGVITREQFEAVPKNLRTANGGSCAQCTRANTFKIQGGRLYTRNTNEDDMTMRMYIDMFILAAHLYNIPDMDFIIHTGDGAVAGMPLLATNIHRDHPQGGFTIPYITDWTHNALSLQQSVALSDCEHARHPLGRPTVPRAIWRGSTSDPLIGTVSLDSIARTVRFKLHMLSTLNPDVLDARITKVIQTPDLFFFCDDNPTADSLCKHQSQGLAELVGQPSAEGGRWQMGLDEFQRFALVMDVDGNSWSSRFLQLSQMSTRPILKQASARQGYYEHFFPPGFGVVAVEPFANNLTDAPHRARQILHDMGYHPEGYYQWQRQRRLQKHCKGLCEEDTTLEMQDCMAKCKEQELLHRDEGMEEEHAGASADSARLGSMGSWGDGTSSTETADLGSYEKNKWRARASVATTGEKAAGPRIIKAGAIQRGKGEHTDEAGGSWLLKARAKAKARKQAQLKKEALAEMGDANLDDGRTLGRKGGMGAEEEEEFDREQQNKADNGNVEDEDFGGGRRRLQGMRVVVDARQGMDKGEARELAQEFVRGRVVNKGRLSGLWTVDFGVRVGKGGAHAEERGVVGGDLRAPSSREEQLWRGGGGSGEGDRHVGVSRHSDLVSREVHAGGGTSMRSNSGVVLKKRREHGTNDDDSSSEGGEGGEGSGDKDVGASHRRRRLMSSGLSLSLTSKGAPKKDYTEQVRNMNAVAALMMNRWTMLEAVAYSLNKYAEMCDWESLPEEGYDLASFIGNVDWVPMELRTQVMDAYGEEDTY